MLLQDDWDGLDENNKRMRRIYLYMLLQDDWDGLDENNKRMWRIYLYIVIQDENEERRIYV